MARKIIKIPEVITVPNPGDRKLYFDNNKVEDLLVRYKWTGCTNVELRDQIMDHAGELIRQVIRTHNLHKIYRGQEDSAFGDLFQTAWVQIEKALYKYKACPHCADCFNAQRPKDSLLYEPCEYDYDIISPEDIAKSKLRCPQCGQKPSRVLYRGTSKIFNMWSQIARTVVLAFIKKEGRDYKNSDAYKNYLGDRHEANNDIMDRFLSEARDIFKYNKSYIEILSALENIVRTDSRPYEGIITKLVQNSGQSRTQVANFLKIIRLRSNEFTDSPFNERPKPQEIRDHHE